QAPGVLMGFARHLIAARQAEVVVIVRSLRSSISIGSTVVRRTDSALRLSAGLSAYPVSASLWARSHLTAAGLPDHAPAAAPPSAGRLAWKPGVARALGSRPAEFGARPLPSSVGEYLASPMIADPLRRDDCVTEVDGAAAVVMVSDAVRRSASTTPLRVA